MSKRNVDVVVLSDTHLGTFGCQADALLRYLKSIQPGTIVLNGDIIDIWQFKKHYWPTSHMKVIKKLIGFAAKGVPVYYLTGNHDEMLRKFAGMSMGNLHIKNKLLLELSTGEKAWIFHGDVFDVTLQHSKWLARLGSVGYDALIILNSIVNRISQRLGKGRLSFSKKIKNSVKTAVKFISAFEHTAAEIAVEQEFDYVICGHIHNPAMRTITTEQGEVQYLNSGDWVENCTALEFLNGRWSLYTHPANDLASTEHEPDDYEFSEPAFIAGEIAAGVPGLGDIITQYTPGETPEEIRVATTG